MFKKIFAVMISAALSAGVMSGCAVSQPSGSKNDGKVSVVCTIFPEYDWVREISASCSDAVNITYLLDKGADLHNFQPSAQDMITVSECDLFIYVGGESDEWVEDALATAKNKDMKVINLMEVMGSSAKEEEIKEGMMPEEEEESDGEEGPEYDEHFWTSLKNAKIFCGEICSALSEINPEHADDYNRCLMAYTDKLDTLDSEFTTMTENASCKTMVFGDRFPFRYFADDYGLDYYAAFAGCSAESEASFETISFLSGKVDELGTDTVFVIENSDKSIAGGIIQNTKSRDQQIAELNSMQSVTADMVENGATYLGLMQDNYNVLKEALN